MLLLLPVMLVLCLLPGGEVRAAADSMFAVSGPQQDIAQQMLDLLLRGTAGFLSNNTGQTLQNGIKAIFAAYSLAVMVFAMVIVVYHLIIIIGETAHTGIPFGKRNRQIWASFRLALGLGLLVPAGGFNGAQYIIMHLARSGSGLASNAWETFAAAAPLRNMNLHGTASVDPAAIIANLVAVGICAKSYEVATGAPPERMAPGMNDKFLQLIVEDGKPVSRILYQTATGQSGAAPVTCGNLTWVPAEQLLDDTASGQVATLFAKAHLDAIKLVQQRALDLGGKLTLGSLNVAAANQGTPYIAEFSGLVKDYQTRFLDIVRAELKINDRNMFSVAGKNTGGAPGAFGWLAAGTMLQKFALTDTVLMTPELAAPVVAFHYPLHAAVHDKATLQLSRGLSFAHLLLRYYDPLDPSRIWFNPQIDHGKGPFKQALTLTATILSRHEKATGSRDFLDPGIDAAAYGNSGLFKPVALGFLSLDLADQFFAVAEWSPRANSPVFGAAMIFSHMAQTVNQAFLAANPKADAAQLSARAAGDDDRPADFARYLLLPVAAALLIPGLLLVFVLPLLPLVRFVIGGVLWLLEIVQGLAAAPLWALTFLSLRGDSLMPQASRLGLVLIFGIFLRPILMVTGFMAALLLMHSGFGLLQLCLQLFTFDGLIGSRTLYSLGPLVLLIANLLLSFGVANASLKCIDLLPEMSLRWLGGAAGGMNGDSGDAGWQGGGNAGGGGTTGNGNGGGVIGGVAGNIAAMQAGQQVWQRKLLNVLEQIVVQNGSSSAQTNTGLFAHLADRPDQKPGAAAPGHGGAAAGGVTGDAGRTETTIHTASAATIEKSSPAAPPLKDDGKLKAQDIRGNPGDKN